MKRIVVDTDVGIDCDDAAALGILALCAAEKKIALDALTLSTARPGAAATARAILSFCGIDVPIGKMAKPYLACDETDAYVFSMMEHYQTDDRAEDAVPLLRRTLAGAEEKITLIGIGPMSNFARLLASPPDGISPLDGVSLVKEKAEAFFVMGGSFQKNYDKIEPALYPSLPYAEWNFGQDPDATRYFLSHCPIPAVFVPSEAGKGVYTALPHDYEPIRRAMCLCAGAYHLPQKDFRRDSWDPVTCLAALGETGDCYTLSEPGTVTLDENGFSVFHPGDGLFRILLLTDRYKEIEETIRAFLP